MSAHQHDVHNAEGLIFFCRARESLSESFVIPAASQNPRHGDDIRVPVYPTCTHAPHSRHTVIFRLDMQSGIDKRTNISR